jgi:hypothetical protein
MGSLNGLLAAYVAGTMPVAVTRPSQEGMNAVFVSPPPNVTSR